MEESNKGSTIVRVELPFAKAVVRAARQNFDRDVRNEVVLESEWDDIQKEYLSEARGILLRDGENTLPTYPDTEHIVVLKSTR